MTTTVLQQITAGTGADTRVNENFQQTSPAALYARNPVTSVGLTWGYKGGQFGAIAVADGTVALTASNTNYIVAARGTGVVSASTATTNWTDTANYLQLHSAVAGTASVTSWSDFRQLIGVASIAAAAVSNTPAGNIAATTVQAAINELDTEKQPVDATLTALAGLATGANKIPYSTGTDTFSQLSLDVDGALAGNSDTSIASQKAVKTYVDTAVTGLLDYKGATDCSANPNYPAALKGDAYVVSVAGKIGGASGVSVAVADMFIALADNAGGTQAGVGASWNVIEHNLPDLGTMATQNANAVAITGGAIDDTPIGVTTANTAKVSTLQTTGNVGFGIAPSANASFYNARPITGGVNAWSHLSQNTVQSGVTTSASVFQSLPSTAAAAFTLGLLYHFKAAQGTVGAGSAVTNQYGFHADSSMTGAATNIGFRGDLSAASGVWNCHMSGLAANYFGGATTFGVKFGYGTLAGSGGAVTQATSKATGVTLDKPCGAITTASDALAATTAVMFTLTNASIGANDSVRVHRKSGGTAGAYDVSVDSVAAGSCVIKVRNNTAGSLSEAVVLTFSVTSGTIA